jgi:hypothetical protein
LRRSQVRISRVVDFHNGSERCLRPLPYTFDYT